jgi:hypothetical protein
MISRRQFLQVAAVATMVRPQADTTYEADARYAQRTGKPRGHEFVFARLRYESGDWDYNPDAGGLLFSDDCNHDVNGLYAKSFEEEMRALFPGDPLAKLPASHPLYRSFFTFTSGPPQTSHELNGWGDNIVHEYLKAIERRGCTATRITAVSGTTTGATSGSCARTTRNSPSTSSST